MDPDRSGRDDDPSGTSDGGTAADDRDDASEASPGDGDGAGGDDEGWRFGVDEVDEDGAVDTREPIEPGSPSLENAAFVLLGALVTVAIIVRVATIMGL